MYQALSLLSSPPALRTFPFDSSSPPVLSMLFFLRIILRILLPPHMLLWPSARTAGLLDRFQLSRRQPHTGKSFHIAREVDIWAMGVTMYG
eukprot:1734573-Pyramimonas_sp.AAC.1